MNMAHIRFNPVYLFLAFFFVCIGTAVSNAEEVEWHPRWNVGDQFTVELVKERTAGPGTKGNAASHKGRVLLDMSVQEKGKDFYIVHCTYGKFELEGEQKNKVKNKGIFT